MTYQLELYGQLENDNFSGKDIDVTYLEIAEMCWTELGEMCSIKSFGQEMKQDMRWELDFFSTKDQEEHCWGVSKWMWERYA